MVDASEFRNIALSLGGVSEKPHFDRSAFVARITFATLAADGASINVKLTPDQQQFKMMMAPDIYAPVSGGWGRQGWTMVELAHISQAELRDLLALAHANAAKKSK